MQVAILGGGIGGLATAIALKQKGFAVEVYERNSRTSDIGAGIVCWPNASFVLDEIGVLKEIAQTSGLINKMNRFSNDGEPIGSLDINKLNQLMTYPSYSILRKNLMQILTRRSIELDIKIHYQHDVIVLSDNNKDKAVVHFNNGKSIQPDIIIGADGRMNSFSRKYVNEEYAPIYQNFVNWVGVVEFKSKIFTELSVSDYWGAGERFGIVPISTTKAYWAGGAFSKNKDKLAPELYKSELNTLFHGWPTLINKIIDETPLSHINKIYVHDHDPIQTWHKNNVVLLGDAAHSPLPTSGQGACQALEDAWHLANCLTEHSNNITKAFKQFTQLRQTKTAGIILGGRQLASSIFNQNLELCKQRNLASKHTDYQSLVVSMAKGWASGLPIST